MDGKVCVVTGATSGVGLETARGLAQRGAHVVLIGRNAERGKAAIDDIARTSGKPHDLEFVQTDLAKLSDVRSAGAAIAAKHGRIDVLVNNAGAINVKRHLTKDGFEETFAVNHLAHFLLTAILLEPLLAAPNGRIINVSSGAHYPVAMDFDDLQSEKRYRTFEVYGRSKLCNVLFSKELARRLGGTSVTANALHPGFVASNFAKNNGGLAKIAMLVLKPFSISNEKGAATSIHLATAPELATVSGEYFAKSKIATPSKEARDPDVARRLWEESEKLTGHPFAAVLPARSRA